MSRVASWFPRGAWTQRPHRRSLSEEELKRKLQKEINADPGLRTTQERLSKRSDFQTQVKKDLANRDPYEVELDKEEERKWSTYNLYHPKTKPSQSAKGNESVKTSDQTADEAVNTPNRSRWEPGETRGHTLTRTGSVGGKGSVANNKEIARKIWADKQAKQEAAAKVQPQSLEQDNKIGKGINEQNKDKNKQLEDKSGDQKTKDKNPKPEDKTPGDQADAKKSEWSKMTGSQKAEAIANIASALQKLDGSKDELIWKGTGWGGIGSGGHSGYVG